MVFKLGLGLWPRDFVRATIAGPREERRGQVLRNDITGRPSGVPQ